MIFEPTKPGDRTNPRAGEPMACDLLGQFRWPRGDLILPLRRMFPEIDPPARRRANQTVSISKSSHEHVVAYENMRDGKCVGVREIIDDLDRRIGDAMRGRRESTAACKDVFTNGGSAVDCFSLRRVAVILSFGILHETRQHFLSRFRINAVEILLEHFSDAESVGQMLLCVHGRLRISHGATSKLGVVSPPPPVGRRYREEHPS